MTALLTDTQPVIIAGVDAHKDTHHVVVLDGNGETRADKQFPVTTDGYRQMLGWVTDFGVLDKIGMESTGSYPAGLTRFLLDAGVDIREVNTSHAHTRARKGMTDAIDAQGLRPQRCSPEMQLPD